MSVVSLEHRKHAAIAFALGLDVVVVDPNHRVLGLRRRFTQRHCQSFIVGSAPWLTSVRSLGRRLLCHPLGQCTTCLTECYREGGVVAMPAQPRAWDWRLDSKPLGIGQKLGVGGDGMGDRHGQRRFQTEEAGLRIGRTGSHTDLEQIQLVEQGNAVAALV